MTAFLSFGCFISPARADFCDLSWWQEEEQQSHLDFIYENSSGINRICDERGNRPAHLAIESILETVMNDAVVELQTALSDMIIGAAFEKGLFILEFLEEQGADVDAMNEDGFTPRSLLNIINPN